LTDIQKSKELAARIRKENLDSIDKQQAIEEKAYARAGKTLNLEKFKKAKELYVSLRAYYF
jgi:hypothetical protein